MILHNSTDNGWVELAEVGEEEVVIGGSCWDGDRCSGGFGGNFGLSLFLEMAEICSSTKTIA
jgi:hypothetical protein